MKNSILSPNSLYGAMAIGGMALAFRLREKWPELVLNETHPKVFFHARWDQRYDSKDKKTVEAAIQWFCPHRPHERDLQRVGKTSSEIAKLYSFRLDRRYGIYGLRRSPSSTLK
jgi:hypothetical protein